MKEIKEFNDKVDKLREDLEKTNVENAVLKQENGQIKVGLIKLEEKFELVDIITMKKI